MRKLFISIAVFILSFSSITSTAFASLPSYGEEWQDAEATQQTVNFSDLPQTNWAYKYIAEMVNRKVISGYPDGKFRPNNTITRAEFAKIMIAASGIDVKKVNYSSFADVPPTNWASPFVEAVNDYMTGYRTANGQYVFNPGQPALREDITVALVKLKGYDAIRLPDHSTLEAMFKDYKGISESAKDYVAIAIENGLVSGYQDDTFRPQATVTRAEAAVLLWRAYQYGNDNKDVGGSDGGTTTTTPSITQPLPSSQPSPMLNQPNQPSHAAKFSVDTLVGGTGAGDVDGPVSKAKIDKVNSITLDKDNNIYFIANYTSFIEKNSTKVRKFNNANGRVETIQLQYSNIDDNYDFSKAYLQILKYNHEDNKLYLGSLLPTYSANNNTLLASIHEITPTVRLLSDTLVNASDERSSAYTLSSMPFICFGSNNKVLYGINYQSTYWDSEHRSFIAQSTLNEPGEVIASSYVLDNTGPEFRDSEAIWVNDHIYIFDRQSKTLSRTQLFPRKVEIVKTFGTISFDSLASFNGRFYASNGTTVYEISIDGSISKFIDGKDLTYNDGNPIQQIAHLNFDSQGNVIFYDEQNNAIRRINL